MQRRKICVVTGTRAEYGLLSRLMKMINSDPTLQLQIVATNMHLSPKYGYTYKEIEADGFKIDKKVDILKFENSNLGVAQTTGLGVIEFSKEFNELKPDLVLILGDRYEMLSVAVAALFLKIPIAHIHGGEITEGAIDDAIRHSITKMSHLHFTSTEEYRKRVIQLGENPKTVYNVGSIGVDNIKHINLLSKDILEKSIDFVISNPTFLVTYHPATLDNVSQEISIKNLLEALDYFPQSKIIFTQPNSDAESELISQMIQMYVNERNNRCKLFASLGHIRYLSALQYVDIVIGNSSSGIIEAPSFGIPSINIGNRQMGRISSKSVINCSTTTSEIAETIRNVLKTSNQERVNFVNPYERSNTAEEILSIIRSINLSTLLHKKFYNQPNEKL